MNLPITIVILGHSNEGKSSVVSTLAENDLVLVSETPGSTTACATYTYTVDGVALVRFVDTPGFQNPKLTHQWFAARPEAEDDLVAAFRRETANRPELVHEREMLAPLEQKAFLLFVVDGSRPVDEDTLTEMKILQRINLPRMGLLNCQDATRSFLPDWNLAMRRTMNSVVEFNAHQASFSERIRLLRSLGATDPEIRAPLDKVIAALETDWNERGMQAARIIADALAQVLQHVERAHPRPGERPEALHDRLHAAYRRRCESMEKEAFHALKTLYRHHRRLDLPEPDALFDDGLFGETTWKLFGLRAREFALASAAGGAALGSLAGPVGAALGGAIGGTAGYLAVNRAPRLQGRSLVQRLMLGKAATATLGPAQVALGWVLFQRLRAYLLFLQQHAHGKRDAETEAFAPLSDKAEPDEEILIALKGLRTPEKPERLALPECLLALLQPPAAGTPAPKK